MELIKKRIPLAFLLIGTAILFWRASHTFFVGDDFWWLYDGSHMMNTPQQWFSAFTTTNGSGTYRPLTQNVFFWIGWNLFGLNPLGYHLLLLATFMIAVYVVYLLFVSIFSSHSIALVSTAVFAFSNTHYASLAWASAFSEVGATLLAALVLYTVAKDRHRLSSLFFTLCLMANETTITLPAMVMLYYMLIRRRSFLDAMRHSKILWIEVSIYMIFRIFVAGLHTGGVFSAVFSLPIWLHLIWSSAVESIGITPTFYNAFGSSGAWHYLSLVALIVYVISGIALAAFFARHIKDSMNGIALGLSWFFIALLPILPFSGDWSYYNLAVPLIGVSVAIGSMLQTVPLRKYTVIPLSVAILALNAAAIYGPGGDNQVHGIRVLASEAYFSVLQIEAARAAQGVPISINLSGNLPLAKWTLSPQWLLPLIDSGGRVCYGASCPKDKLSLVLTQQGVHLLNK
ncbi:MAG: hypothetical protein ACYCVB_18020 [Bacilli bacterium]